MNDSGYSFHIFTSVFLVVRGFFGIKVKVICQSQGHISNVTFFRLVANEACVAPLARIARVGLPKKKSSFLRYQT